MMAILKDFVVRRSKYYFGLLLVFWSCLAPVDFDTENIGGRLVVGGQVSTITDNNFVQVGRTADSDRLPFPVSGAVVNVVDELGEYFPYNEDPNTPGIYRPINLVGVPGRSYYVEVRTPDDETYRSTAERMPEAAGEVTTTYEIAREEFIDFEGIASLQPFIRIYVNSNLPSDAFVKWSCSEAFLLSPTDFPDPFGNIPPPCYVVQNADPQRVALFNGVEVNTQTVEGILVVSRIVDWTFLEKHHFTVYQSSITQEAIEYWRKVNVLANQVGSIFDTPPAEINGNIQNLNNSDEKVYGYFQASNEVFHRFTLYRQDLPFPLTVPDCTYEEGNFIDYPPRCLDCLTVPNSSYTRPPWF